MPAHKVKVIPEVFELDEDEDDHNPEFPLHPNLPNAKLLDFNSDALKLAHRQFRAASAGSAIETEESDTEFDEIDYNTDTPIKTPRPPGYFSSPVLGRSKDVTSSKSFRPAKSQSDKVKVAMRILQDHLRHEIDAEELELVAEQFLVSRPAGRAEILATLGITKDEGSLDADTIFNLITNDQSGPKDLDTKFSKLNLQAKDKRRSVNLNRDTPEPYTPLKAPASRSTFGGKKKTGNTNSKPTISDSVKIYTAGGDKTDNVQELQGISQVLPVSKPGESFSEGGARASVHFLTTQPSSRISTTTPVLQTDSFPPDHTPIYLPDSELTDDRRNQISSQMAQYDPMGNVYNHLNPHGILSGPGISPGQNTYQYTSFAQIPGQGWQPGVGVFYNTQHPGASTVAPQLNYGVMPFSMGQDSGKVSQFQSSISTAGAQGMEETSTRKTISKRSRVQSPATVVKPRTGNNFVQVMPTPITADERKLKSPPNTMMQWTVTEAPYPLFTATVASSLNVVDNGHLHLHTNIAKPQSPILQVFMLDNGAWEEVTDRYHDNFDETCTGMVRHPILGEGYVLTHDIEKPERPVFIQRQSYRNRVRARNILTGNA